MRIGALAQACGLTPKTIRFYEQVGLLAPPPRTSGGFRDYPPETMGRLRFIRDAPGLSLSDIGGILTLRDSGQPPCAHVEALITERLTQIELRLAELRAARAELRAIARRATEIHPDTCLESDICTILAGQSQRRDRATRRTP